MLTQHGIYIFRITIFCLLNIVILVSKHMNGQNDHALVHLYFENHILLGVHLISGKFPDCAYRSKLCKKSV